MTVKEKCILSYSLGEEKLNRIVFRGDDKKTGSYRIAKNDTIKK
jgi:hypothetical protein